MRYRAFCYDPFSLLGVGGSCNHESTMNSNPYIVASFKTVLEKRGRNLETRPSFMLIVAGIIGVVLNGDAEVALYTTSQTEAKG